jgi:hypothetical protein
VARRAVAEALSTAFLLAAVVKSWVRLGETMKSGSICEPFRLCDVDSPVCQDMLAACRSQIVTTAPSGRGSVKHIGH